MPHHPPRPFDHLMTRREALCRGGMGIGSLALGSILAETGALGADAAKPAPPSTAAGVNPLAPRAPQFPGKAKRVVHLFMNGGPSHVDTFDPKPMLDKYHGKAVPTNRPTERKTGAAFRSPFKFKKYGQSGIEISDVFAKTGAMADELCVIRSMHADVPNHEPSLLLMNCGEPRQSRPSLGSWVLYGLGTENQNLPGFITMCPFGYPIQESQNWQCGFLPGVYQGTYIDSQHTDLEKLIAHIRNRSVNTTAQRAQLDLLGALNREHIEKRHNEAALEARIQSFELAFRMQSEAGDAFDVSREPEHIRTMYGPGVQARQLLITRRLLERGVRFVQLWHGAGQPWDSHDDIEVQHRRLGQECDQGIAAFLKDLKQRGMLDETLVIWGGEFGRTPMGQGSGRDHHINAFSLWLAGGGIKPGITFGATDELGYRAVEDVVSLHDLHATMLHLCGVDHARFSVKFQGLDARLTGVEPCRVVKPILA
jgi:hypothetical protein